MCPALHEFCSQEIAAIGLDLIFNLVDAVSIGMRACKMCIHSGSGFIRPTPETEMLWA
jgi:hypothetical protein